MQYKSIMAFKSFLSLSFMYLTNECLGYTAYTFNFLSKSTMCPFYNITEYFAQSETICSIMCQRRISSENCRGFCYVHDTSICELYSVPNLEGNSQVLRWISITELDVEMESFDSFQECKKNKMGLVLPMSEEENLGTWKLSSDRYYIDLFDVNFTKDFRTYEEERAPKVTFFYFTEPNTKSHQCVRGNFQKSTGLWDDYLCDLKLPVICQVPKPFECDEGEFSNKTLTASSLKSCYKYQF